LSKKYVDVHIVAVRQVLLSPGHDLLYSEMRAKKSRDVTLGSFLTSFFQTCRTPVGSKRVLSEYNKY
jgi:hypothetical protein